MKTGQALSLLAEQTSELAPQLAVACSLGIEDAVILELLRQAAVHSKVNVFTLDTGRLGESSYQYLEQLSRHYGITIASYVPQAQQLESLLAESGPNGFKASVQQRKRCCHVRKVEPLTRALSEAKGWIVGLRREQSSTRASIEEVEPDQANRGIVRIAPLAHWSEQEVWQFAKEHKVPIHPLHLQGYPSIGCAPCTRAVDAWRRGQTNDLVHIRAGRWWWESPEHKECGIHFRKVVS